MNHTFIAAPWSPKICRQCAKPELVHGDSVTCESCSNIGPVNLIGKILMCKSCEDRHNGTIPSEPIKSKLSIEQVVNQVNRLVETDAIKTPDGDTVKTIIDEAIKGNIKEFKDFFNAKMPSIIELKELVYSDNSLSEDDKKYALATALGARVKYLGMVLFQFNSHSIEVSAEVKSIQQYMNGLIPQLRQEQRTQFAANDINFVPQPIKASNAPKVRMSTTDKLAEGYAKMMGVTLEQAKVIIARKVKPECTCVETPGLCKVHSK